LKAIDDEHKEKQKMKYTNPLYLFLAIAFLVLSANTGYSQSCEMDSSFAPSNIDIVPSKVLVAKPARVRVDIVNSGTCTWDRSSVKLAIKVIRKPSGSPSTIKEIPEELALRQSVYSKKSHTWYFEITGPYYLGTYTLEFTLTNKGKPFGNEVQKIFEVVPPK
jgi:hypothetical protein